MYLCRSYAENGVYKMNNIKLMNKIAAVGIDEFDAAKYNSARMFPIPAR